jgi:hypothetical protein
MTFEFFHDTKICKSVNRDSVCRFFCTVQLKSCNLLRFLGHVEKLSAGQGSLFLTDMIKVCVEQTSCCWVVQSLSTAFTKQCLIDCKISVIKTISYSNVIINVPKYGMVGKTFAVVRTLFVLMLFYRVLHLVAQVSFWCSDE